MQLNRLNFLKTIQWQALCYLLFVSGFFFIPSSKWHNNLYYALVLLPALLQITAIPWRNLWQSSVYRFSILLLTYLGLSFLWSEHWTLDGLRDQIMHWIYVVIFLSLTIHLLQVHKTFLVRLYQWLATSAAITGVIAILLFYWDHAFPTERLSHFSRLDNAILAATLYGMVLLIIGYALLRQTTGWLKGWFVFAALLSLVYIVLSQSRGPLIALVMTLALSILLRRDRLSLAILVLPILLYLGVFGLDLDALWQVLGRHGIDSYRFVIWQQVLPEIAQAPWFGHGILYQSDYATGMGQTVPHAHNLLLAIWLYGGVIAVWLLSILVLLCLQQGVAQWRQYSDFTLLALLVFAILCLFTDGYQVLTNPRPIWLYFWVPVALASYYELRSKR